MNLAWLDTPTIAVLAIYVMTCLPLAWAHATLAQKSSERLLIWAAALALAVLIVLLGRTLYLYVLEFTRVAPGGGRSWLLKVGLAGLIGISLCAPVGLIALRLLKHRT